MFVRFSWLGIGLCAAVSLGGATSYANQVAISFGDCTQINQIITPGVVCPNADSTKSQITYSTGGLSVTATGFLNPVSVNTTNGGSENLYVKSLGTGETGLGTVIDVQDHEITAVDYVNFDLSNLFAKGITTGQLTIESLQTGENFSLCQGAMVGAFGTTNCQSGGAGSPNATKTITITWGVNTDILGIQGSGVAGADVLVDGLTIQSPAPEPASVLLFGTGIASFIVKGRHRKDKKQTAKV